MHQWVLLDVTIRHCAYLECSQPGVWCLMLTPLRAWVCDEHRQILLDDLAKVGLVPQRASWVR